MKEAAHLATHQCCNGLAVGQRLVKCIPKTGLGLGWQMWEQMASVVSGLASI